MPPAKVVVPLAAGVHVKGHSEDERPVKSTNDNCVVYATRPAGELVEGLPKRKICAEARKRVAVEGEAAHILLGLSTFDMAKGKPGPSHVKLDAALLGPCCLMKNWTPKSILLLRHYSRAAFLADLIAGVTVGLVALPLAMAFAISSGVLPQAGLYGAVITGLVISALGGSRFQIGGPTGAFVVASPGSSAPTASTACSCAR
jgi:hypothetical protein